MTQQPGDIRWGIVGAANIARAQFLPALREAGGGRAVLVGSRDAQRAAAFAAEHGVERGVAGYEQIVESADVDAVYVALPNSLHAEWAGRALQAGKAVLCEKMLTPRPEQTAALLDLAAAAPGGLLWEAFVFPFQAQHQRVRELIADGAIGEVAEIVSAFHFQVSSPANIRLSGELGGGCLADVGCYPVRLAAELYGPAGATVVAGAAVTGGGEVEVDAAGIVTWGAARRLMLTCGFRRSYDTFTRILGDQGQLHLTNPFHPGRPTPWSCTGAGASPSWSSRPPTPARSRRPCGTSTPWCAARPHPCISRPGRPWPWRGWSTPCRPPAGCGDGRARAHHCHRLLP